MIYLSPGRPLIHPQGVWSQFTCYSLLVTGYLLLVTCYRLPVTHYSSSEAQRSREDLVGLVLDRLEQ